MRASYLDFCRAASTTTLLLLGLLFSASCTLSAAGYSFLGNDSNTRVVSMEAEFAAALADPSINLILVNATSGPFILTQAYWAQFKTPIMVNRTLIIEPTPDSPPMPIFDFGYVNGKAHIAGCDPLPPPKMVPSSAPPPKANFGATAKPPVSLGATGSRRLLLSGANVDNTLVDAESNSIYTDERGAMVIIRNFELRQIQVRVSFGFWVSDSFCELRVEACINHLEVAMPRSQGEMYWNSAPRPGQYGKAGWKQLFQYQPTFCYPHNASACYSPGTMLWDVALVQPRTDVNGGYLLHYFHSFSHGDTIMDEACVKVMSYADCAQRALAKLHGYEVPELGGTFNDFAGKTATGSAAAGPSDHHHGPRLDIILPLSIGLPVLLLAVLICRWMYLLRVRQGDFGSFLTYDGDNATAMTEDAAAGKRRRMHRLLSLLGSMATTVWGSASGSGGSRRTAGSSDTYDNSGPVSTVFMSLLSGPDGISIGSLLGSGSFGKVFEGMWRGRRVAVKVVTTHSRQEDDKVQREVKLASELSHPNIVATLTSACVGPASRTAILPSVPEAAAITTPIAKSTPAAHAVAAPALAESPTRSSPLLTVPGAPNTVAAAAVAVARSATPAANTPSDAATPYTGASKATGGSATITTGLSTGNRASSPLTGEFLSPSGKGAPAKTAAAAAVATLTAADISPVRALASNFATATTSPCSPAVQRMDVEEISQAGEVVAEGGEVDAFDADTPPVKAEPSCFIIQPVRPGTRTGTPRPPMSSCSNTFAGLSSVLHTAFNTNATNTPRAGNGFFTPGATPTRRRLFGLNLSPSCPPAPISNRSRSRLLSTGPTPVQSPGNATWLPAGEVVTPRPAAVVSETWIVMEMCDGGSLAAAVSRGEFRRSGELDMLGVLAVARDIARGMAYLHNRGIVHGDLKAENVMLCRRPGPTASQQAPSTAVATATAASSNALGRSLPSSNILISSTLGGTGSGVSRGTGAVPVSSVLQLTRSVMTGSANGSASGGMGSSSMYGTPGGSSCMAEGGLDNFRYVAKVCDFGLSRALDPGATHLRTEAGGSISHMAPECLLRGEMRREGDVYAFGIMLWELCTGAKAYAGMSHGEVVQAVVMRGKRPELPPHSTTSTAGTATNTIIRTLPEALSELASDCWAASPESRPSFEEVLYRIDCLVMPVAVVMMGGHPGLGSNGEQNTAANGTPVGGVYNSSVSAGAQGPPAAVPSADGVGSGRDNPLFSTNSNTPPAAGLPGLMSYMARLTRRGAAKCSSGTSSGTNACSRGNGNDNSNTVSVTAVAASLSPITSSGMTDNNSGGVASSIMYDNTGTLSEGARYSAGAWNVPRSPAMRYGIPNQSTLPTSTRTDDPEAGGLCSSPCTPSRRVGSLATAGPLAVVRNGQQEAAM